MDRKLKLKCLEFFAKGWTLSGITTGTVFAFFGSDIAFVYWAATSTLMLMATKLAATINEMGDG